MKAATLPEEETGDHHHPDPQECKICKANVELYKSWVKVWNASAEIWINSERASCQFWPLKEQRKACRETVDATEQWKDMVAKGWTSGHICREMHLCPKKPKPPAPAPAPPSPPSPSPSDVVCEVCKANAASFKAWVSASNASAEEWIEYQNKTCAMWPTEAQKEACYASVKASEEWKDLIAKGYEVQDICEKTGYCAHKVEGEPPRSGLFLGLGPQLGPAKILEDSTVPEVKSRLWLGLGPQLDSKVIVQEAANQDEEQPNLII